MRSTTREIVHGANRRGGNWQAPATAEAGARKQARRLVQGTAEACQPTASTPLPRTHDAAALHGAGRPLTGTERAPMETALRADFSAVRLHTEGAAAQAAQDLGARAFTLGSDVAFAPGEYAARHPASRELLAHELVHVRQQAGAQAAALQFEPRQAKAGIGSAPPDERFISDPGDWGSEDDHLLFDADRADLADDAALRSVASGVKVPSEVFVHGYASAEGPADYNLNLSAHRAVAVKQRLEKLLPPGSKVTVFAHGDTRHFGASEANRRVGVSVIGPVAAPGFRLEGGLGAGLHRPAPWIVPGPAPARPPVLRLDALPPPSVVDTRDRPTLPGLPPAAGTPRSLMDNAALLAPGASHPLDVGNPVDYWDAAYGKYHRLGVPDELKLGPIELGAAALANKETANAIDAYHQRNDPTVVESSNAAVGAHVLMSPNLLDLGSRRKKGKDAP